MLQGDSLFDHAEATPSQVILEVFRRLEAEDFDGAAALHHSDYVEAAAHAALQEVRPEQRSIPTVDDLLRRRPDMPRAVAEYEVEQARAEPRRVPYLNGVFGISSPAELVGMSPREILARRLQAADLRRMHRDYLRSLALRYPDYESQLLRQCETAYSQWRGDVCGHVIGPSRAYVVVDGHPRTLGDVREDLLPNVIVLRESTEGWGISCDIRWSGGLIHFHVRVDGPGGEPVVLS